MPRRASARTVHRHHAAAAPPGSVPGSEQRVRRRTEQDALERGADPDREHQPADRVARLPRRDQRRHRREREHGRSTPALEAGDRSEPSDQRLSTPRTSARHEADRGAGATASRPQAPGEPRHCGPRERRARYDTSSCPILLRARCFDARSARGRPVVVTVGGVAWSRSAARPAARRRDGAPVAFDTRKALALLAHLALDRARRAPATRWPTCCGPAHDPEHARGALRRTLSTLRGGVGAEHLEADPRPGAPGRGRRWSSTSTGSARWPPPATWRTAVEVFRGDLPGGLRGARRARLRGLGAGRGGRAAPRADAALADARRRARGRR